VYIAGQINEVSVRDVVLESRTWTRVPFLGLGLETGRLGLGLATYRLGLDSSGLGTSGLELDFQGIFAF